MNLLLVNELADEFKGAAGHGRAILCYGIEPQRQTIKQIVIIKTAQVDIGIHQLVLIQIAQNPFQQTAGGGEQRLGGRPNSAHNCAIIS